MPLISSRFKAQGLFKDAHFSTIYSAKMRRVTGVVQERERVELPDGDFLDIDWIPRYMVVNPDGSIKLYEAVKTNDEALLKAIKL